MLWQQSGIYNTESYNSQQNEPFDINWLICIFCITVNISFNVCAQVERIYIHGNHCISNANVMCMLHLSQVLFK